jgi:hypothetical protein
MEIFVDGPMIILKKYIPENLDLPLRKKKYICSVCKRELEAAEAEKKKSKGNKV